MTRLILVSACLIVFAAGLGCGGPGLYRATPSSKTTLEDTDKVTFKDEDLQKSISVVDVSQDDVNGLLRARCRLRNMTDKPVRAEIKVKFRDAQGYELDDSAPWTPLPLESGEIKSFEQIASNPDAVDFRIMVQLAGEHTTEN